jgi:ABC-type transporter Mla subunit MlaD
MTTLKETLPILDAAVPLIPGKVAEAEHEGQEFRQAVEDLLRLIEQQRAGAGQMLSRVKEALAVLQDAAAERQGQVVEGLQSVEATLAEALEGVEEGRDELSEGLDAAGSDIQALETHLGDGGQRTQSARDDAARAIDELKAEVHEGQTGLEGALHAATAAVDAVGGELEEAQGVLADAAAQLNATMAELLERARTRLGGTHDRLKGLQAELEASVTGAVSELASRKEQLLEDVRERLQDEVRQRLDAGLDTVAESLGQLGDAVAEATRTCQQDREEVEQRFEALRQRMPPLQDAVVCVKQAAEQVGVAWA